MKNFEKAYFEQNIYKGIRAIDEIDMKNKEKYIREFFSSYSGDVSAKLDEIIEFMQETIDSDDKIKGKYNLEEIVILDPENTKKFESNKKEIEAIEEYVDIIISHIVEEDLDEHETKSTIYKSSLGKIPFGLVLRKMAENPNGKKYVDLILTKKYQEKLMKTSNEKEETSSEKEER